MCSHCQNKFQRHFFFKSMLFLFLLCFICHWYTYPLYVLCSRSTNYIYNLLHCTFTLLLSISILVNQLLENSLNICEIFQWKCKTDVQLQWPKSQRATAETWSKDFNLQLWSSFNNIFTFSLFLDLLICDSEAISD